jgi:hypothetical protein
MLQPRSGYNANMFCRHDETQTSTYYNWRGEETALVAEAGNVAVITGCDGETTKVKRMAACTEKPFGLLMQDVRKAYDHAYMPWGYIKPFDLSSQLAFIGGPIAVAHLGVHDTTAYDGQMSGVTAGSLLYPTASGTLTTASGSNNCATAIAVAMNTLTQAQVEMGRMLRIKLLI